MANQEHLDILAKGVEAWNRWREEFNGSPDLRGADLRGHDFSLANLFNVHFDEAMLQQAIFHDADCSSAIFRRAKLMGSKFGGANLEEADLEAADLENAHLAKVNFVYANLRGANLRQSNLGWASLTRTDVTDADFTGTNLFATAFNDMDLSAAKGLEYAQHEGPSSIGIDTIYLSKGKIPDAFLRGAGVPDSFMESMRSLTDASSEFCSCFISYSERDKDFAERLHTDLQAKGVRCWFAPEDLKIGDRFQERIEESIRVFDKVMIVLSEGSVQSRWVEREVNAAMEREGREKGTILFPIRIDEAVMDAPQPWAADIRRSRHIGDFRCWKNHDTYVKALDRLLRDLKASEAVRR